MSVETPRRTLHSKRSFAKYPKLVDSPAYDASEEDNDPLTDDGTSRVSLPAPARNGAPASRLKQTHSKKHHLASSALVSDSDGVDSPTYDGDIESSTTLGPPRESTTHNHHPSTSTRPHHHHSSSSVSTLNTPVTPAFPPSSSATPNGDATLPPVFISAPHPALAPLVVPEEPAVPEATKEVFNPAALTPDDIQAFVRKAIDGDPDFPRPYKINEPPVDRPIRIYADGVYDLFHFGHALQLRQAKLSFPNVYLLVGVNSDELVRKHKANTVMTHAERLEAARHCRWVDEVVSSAPWVIDQSFLDEYAIDYVAHDEVPYATSDCDDAYGYVKSQGKFIPTRRTPGVSTSELLERIVSGYRMRAFDEKLVKMGHAELKAEGSDYDDMSPRSSRFVSRVVSRAESRAESPVAEET
ncbi:hypothetical protein BDQ17DRAFT_1308242 [Cyathus striatus]|nr:hypothetical protein BDQ17DRAFT_1308242 [Cyathus striatus]